MDILLTLFFIFFKLSFFSFGGGYVMIPLIEQELVSNNIHLEANKISNIVAIAGMAPGPVAINAAIGFGYEIGGMWGVIFSFIGIVIPSLLIVIISAILFKKIYSSKYFKWSMYGLSPIIVGIILYAAVNMAIKNNMIFSKTSVISSGWYVTLGSYGFELKSILLVVISFLLLLKTKIHPIILIVGGGIIGILVF